ncbi:hypothetical protein M422DRAFT_785001 [Sphaerobolus stellatus SS14]|uniref:Magnesium transporter n=1 Tax=Sphaerobolus stellatus (strain SS14) TaxID=990650 RepID=A0A0C9TD83_SPHS4|nr:hypothetical protein M422DRAFT_785001 [Sphaerobolus stellatus SS14]
MQHTQTAEDPPISIAVGITIGLLASLVQSLGLTIQRKSHIINESKPDGEKRVEHRRPLWLLGFGIFFSSNLLGSFVQIASLPVVILAPLGAVSLLWNAFFSRLILGDVFSPYMIFGTLAIAGGAVLIAIFGIVPEPTHSLEDLLVLLSRPPFVVYFSLLGTIVGLVLIVTHIIEFSLRTRLLTPNDTPQQTPTHTPSLQSQSLPPLAAVPSSLPLTTEASDSTERTPLLSKPSKANSRTPSSIKRTRLFLAISYASISGILSGMCLIFAKSGVELLILTVKGDNQFWRWESWALLIGLVVFALLQLWYLHKSLILANPVLVCPLAFCFYNLSSIVNGLVYYDQFGALTTLHLWLVVLGMVVLLAGVWAVSVTSGDGGGVEPGTWDAAESEAGEQETAAEHEHDGVTFLRQTASYPVSSPPPSSPLGEEESHSHSPTRKRQLRRQKAGRLAWGIVNWAFTDVSRICAEAHKTTGIGAFTGRRGK